MSDSEELPDIDEDDVMLDDDDDILNRNIYNKPQQSSNNSKDMNISSDESDLEVVWEGNNSQEENNSSEDILMDIPIPPIPSSSSSSSKSTKTNPIHLLSDSEDAEEDVVSTGGEKTSYRVLPPKKDKSKKRNPKGSENNDAKEQKRLEKENEKEVKRLERERKKVEAERAKELRKATSQVQKSTKPGESIKHMTLIMDSTITTKYDALIPVLVSSDVTYELDPNPLIESSILFKRELIHQAMGDDLKIKIVSKFVDEDQLIIVLDSDKVIPMVYAQLNKASSEMDGDENELDLITWVESIKSLLSEKKLTLFLYDMEKYFKKIKKNTQQEFRNRVLNVGNANPVPKRRQKQASSLLDVSQTELASSLIEMQLETGVNYRMVKNVSDLGFNLKQYTKAIAEAPFKKQRIEANGFDWFALADATGSVKVDKDTGTGLKQLWVEQLQQFTSIGPDMAFSISNRYPSPMKLLEAYKTCNNQDEGESLLKNLTVTSGIGPLARTRKVGPESSKKLYRFFTSTNGDRFLGSSDSR